MGIEWKPQTGKYNVGRPLSRQTSSGELRPTSGCKWCVIAVQNGGLKGQLIYGQRWMSLGWWWMLQAHLKLKNNIYLLTNLIFFSNKYLSVPLQRCYYGNWTCQRWLLTAKVLENCAVVFLVPRYPIMTNTCSSCVEPITIGCDLPELSAAWIKVIILLTRDAVSCWHRGIRFDWFKWYMYFYIINVYQ